MQTGLQTELGVYIVGMLTCAVSVWLATELSKRKMMPVFCAYLCLLTMGILTRTSSNQMPGWVGVLGVLFKFAASVEAIMHLCKSMSKSESRWTWMFGSFMAGVALIILWDAPVQPNLNSPWMTYIKASTEAFLMVVMLCLSLWAWAYCDVCGYVSSHAWLLTAMWAVCAACDLIAPQTNLQWLENRLYWEMGLIILLATWNVIVRRMSVNAQGLLNEPPVLLIE